MLKKDAPVVEGQLLRKLGRRLLPGLAVDHEPLLLPRGGVAHGDGPHPEAVLPPVYTPLAPPPPPAHGYQRLGKRLGETT
jgi:hypothetical protein